MTRLAICAALLSALPTLAEDKKTVEALATRARKSVVVVTITGRDGKQAGLGTGFVIGKGLIATNLHVVGQARPITLETTDGKKHKVIEIHASDKRNDLAIIRIKDETLPILKLADSSKARDGQKVVALGNPLGLKHSVVSGVISGRRVFDGRRMIQIAIPVERGNSGGPLLDEEGHVLGVMTMKSLVTANLGFAVESNSLKALLAKPNPVPMSAWLTIGALDRDEWDPRLGSQWRQRAGRIIVKGMGTGFGGRSFCLSKLKTPALPFEIAVTVKLDDESGAAGLIFHSDGKDKHYGFYPTGGGLRLTRFDGPTVYSWQILGTVRSSHYKPGEWSTLKVRVEKNRIRCYVNDQLAIESKDGRYTQGQVGLTKFRNTDAEFKKFQVAKEIKPTTIPEKLATRIRKSIQALEGKPALTPKLLESLGNDGEASLRLMQQRAKELEKQAEMLRQFAQRVHEKQIENQLKKAVGGKEEDIDLIHAALLIAQLDNRELEISVYRQQMDRLAKKLKSKLPKNANDKVILEALNRFMFKERGFHGSRSDYYHRSNSYLNEVLDDREGLPITLSIVYVDLARRLGLKMEGVGLPGHFIVRHVPKKGKPQLIDVYDGGVVLSRADAGKKVQDITGRPLEDRHLKAVTKKEIIVRVLHNLIGIAQNEEDFKGMNRYLNSLLAVMPESSSDRGTRVVVRWRLGKLRGALEDIDWLLDQKPEGLDLDRVRAIRARIERELRQQSD